MTYNSTCELISLGGGVCISCTIEIMGELKLLCNCFTFLSKEIFFSELTIQSETQVQRLMAQGPG